MLFAASGPMFFLIGIGLMYKFALELLFYWFNTEAGLRMSTLELISLVPLISWFLVLGLCSVVPAHTAVKLPTFRSFRPVFDVITTFPPNFAKFAMRRAIPAEQLENEMGHEKHIDAGRLHATHLATAPKNN